MRYIKFSFMYTDSEKWLDYRFDLNGILNGEPFDIISDSPLLRKFKMVSRRQYTGLKDKNGVEVYEGDICKWLSIVFAVEWSQEDCAFTLSGQGMGAMMNQDYLDNFEVIGNIHENKDLMK